MPLFSVTFGFMMGIQAVMILSISVISAWAVLLWFIAMKFLCWFLCWSGALKRCSQDCGYTAMLPSFSALDLCCAFKLWWFCRSQWLMLEFGFGFGFN
jgi:hypothetical protein